MSDKLTRLTEVMKMINETPSKEELLAFFKTVLDFVKQLKTVNQELVASLERKYTEVSNSLSDNKSELETARKEVMKMCKDEMSKMHKEMTDKSKEMEDTMKENLQDPAQIALEASTIVFKAIEDKIPTLEQLEEKIPALGEKIVDAINLLPTDNDEDKIGLEHIRGLRDELDRILQLAQSKTQVFGGGGVGKTNVYYSDLSSSLDGSTKTFTMGAFARIIDVKLSSAPVLRQTIDYTIDYSAHTITFTDQIPVELLTPDQSFIVLYAN